MFSLRLFGGASLEGPDGPLTGRATQRHRVALLALLATAGRGGMSRDKLIAYLWPELDAERGRHLLSNSLYVLRQTLGDALPSTAADAVRLDTDRVSCDVRSFEEALARGDFGGAVAAYSGPFLDGFFLADNSQFEEWMERERGRLADGYLRALEALAEAAEGEGSFQDAAEWWKTRVAQDPLDTRVVLRLMQAQEASGSRAAALQTGIVHQRLLQEQLGLDPSPEVAALVERLRNQPAGDAARGQIAATPTSPVGREPAPAGTGLQVAADDSRSSPLIDPPPGNAAAAGVASRRRRWLGGVLFLAAVALAGTVWTVWPRNQPDRSIVVLPFVSMATADDSAYFADGLTEEVITRLASVPELKVISRTSAMHYKESSAPVRQIADELNVTYVLEGSVRRSDGRLRITAQLIDARADEHLWARSYDYEVRDVFRVQEEIAREVVRTLEVELGERGQERLARQGTLDPQAYDNYRRGRFLWSKRTKEGHARALQYFQRAIERDSAYPDAYAAMADAYLTGYQLGLSHETEEEAYSRHKWAAERALALDDQSADARVALAISLWWQRNWPGAEREFRRALELNSGHASARGWYAVLLTGMGRTEDALRESRHAYALDPFEVIISITYAWACYMAREYDCAVAQYHRTLELDRAWAPAYAQLGLAYAQQGKFELAIREASKALGLHPQSPEYRADLAYVYARAGRKAEARELLKGATAKARDGYGFPIARAYAALGEPDSAFVWLERHAWHWAHRGVRVDPALDPVRSDPRFADLAVRVERDMGMR